jgi:hypothetical protein
MLDDLGDDPIDESPHNSAVSVTQYLSKLATEQFANYRCSLMLQTTKMLLPAIISEAKRQREPRLVYQLAFEAMQVIRDIDLALHPDEHISKDHRYELWTRQANPTWKTSADHWKWPEKDMLQQAAADYLARPWMHHDYIHWCIVDALAYWEWQAFVYKLSMRAAQIWFGLGAAVFIMIANVTFGLFKGKDIHLAFSLGRKHYAQCPALCHRRRGFQRDRDCGYNLRA